MDDRNWLKTTSQKKHWGTIKILKRRDTLRKEFNKSDTKHTSRMNVFTGRVDHAPESKLVPTFARHREVIKYQKLLRAQILFMIVSLSSAVRVSRSF